METAEIIKIVLASTVISGIISAIVSYIISVRLKNIDYKNEYYKKILDKRLDAYQYLENQIAVMKTTVMDDEDGKAYHFVLGKGREGVVEFHRNLLLAMSYSLWINDKTVKVMEELNQCFYLISLIDNKNEIISRAKRDYHKIAGLRKKLEKSVKSDLFSLHNLDRFIKEKKHEKLRLFYYKDDS
ncbi:hypothetical protein PG279_06075 [Riemerella anatipestifer]|nr:hypothetical protein [Riemerella anatipestifer]